VINSFFFCPLVTTSDVRIQEIPPVPSFLPVLTKKQKSSFSVWNWGIGSSSDWKIPI